MQIKEATQHCEVGVYYSWLKYPTIEPIARGMTPHTYTWKHIPSGKTGVHTVYLWYTDHLFKLLAHWSRTNDWQYTASVIA